MPPPLNDRAGKREHRVHDTGGKGDEGNPENHGQKQLKAAGYIIFIHNKNDTAEGHCHNGNPFTRRPGDGVHHPFQGAGKFRDAARCSGEIGEAQAERQKAENGQACAGLGPYARQTGKFSGGKKGLHVHDDLRGGRHAALGWGARPADVSGFCSADNEARFLRLQ